MDQYQEYIHASRYARWLPEEKRRETWAETVARYVGFWEPKVSDSDTLRELQQAIENLEVMPSMRAMMTAGPALERDNVAGFNCSYLPIDHPRAFDELMYILLCGTGVGFSVERVYIDSASLPDIPDKMLDKETTIIVPDSKVGWADSFRQLISLLWAGAVPQWDVSRVRPEGSPLKTFGGRASGPQPLVDLFEFTVALFRERVGKRLTDLDCHDLCCKIAEVIVVGGVRRSALISLSNPTSPRMATAKHGLYPNQRALANNSGCFTTKPDLQFFYKYMGEVYDSYAGERGVFSREAATNIAARNGRRKTEGVHFGTNPCSEIILRPNQFCNLSEVVVRESDTLKVLKDKVRKAAILGTLQATLTDFRYLRKVWKTNTEEEALLGLSFTGLMDHPVLSGGRVLDKWLKEMKDVAIETNAIWAAKLGINPAAAITCVKPSGTVSQLVNSASGIHPRFSDYYIRTVRADKKDPLAQYMRSKGFPVETDITKESVDVFSFPQKAPEGATTTSDVTALDQLELWKTYQEHWCEHKPSCTVYYTDDEWLDVCAWMWKNFDILSGISVLPFDGGVYKQAPYQAITQDKYEELLPLMPVFDWEELAEFEGGVDSTTGTQELACTAGGCEI